MPAADSAQTAARTLSAQIWTLSANPAQREKNAGRNLWALDRIIRMFDLMFSTRMKDAGIAIRHSRGWILFYTAGSRKGLERWSVRAHTFGAA